MKLRSTFSPATFLVLARLGACFSTGRASGYDSQGRLILVALRLCFRAANRGAPKIGYEFAQLPAPMRFIKPFIFNRIINAPPAFAASSKEV